MSYAGVGDKYLCGRRAGVEVMYVNLPQNVGFQSCYRFWSSQIKNPFAMRLECISYKTDASLFINRRKTIILKNNTQFSGSWV